MRSRWFQIGILVIAGAALGVLITVLALTLPTARSASGALGGLGVSPATLIAANTYPAVQGVETDFTATVTWSQPVRNEAAFRALEQRVQRQVTAGLLDGSDASVTEAAVTELVRNPFAFFTPGQASSKADMVPYYGSGWVVSPDGYIITAAHVVKPDPAEITQIFATGYQQQVATETLKTFTDAGLKATPEQTTRLNAALTTWVAKYLKVTDLKSTVSVQFGVAEAAGKTHQGHPVDVVAVGETFPGKDVAILKLDGETHLPTLPVGTDDDISPGSTLYLAGYPAASTFFTGASQDSQIQPTITQGPLTAVKSSTAGTPYFQTQAPASPGNSGGPVLDEEGKVIGIFVAFAPDEQGKPIQGQEYVVPISVITEKLRDHSIRPATSDTSVVYAQAVAEFYQHHYRAALPLFQQAAALDPGHPYANRFISRSTSGIEAGHDTTPESPWFWLSAGASGLAGVLLIGVLVTLVRRARGRRPATAGQPHGETRPDQAYPDQAYPDQAYPDQAYPARQAQPYPAPVSSTLPPRLAVLYPPLPPPGAVSPGHRAPGQDLPADLDRG